MKIHCPNQFQIYSKFRRITSLSVASVVNFKLLVSAQVLCNIVCVQVGGRIHRELYCENKFLSKLITENCIVKTQ